MIEPTSRPSVPMDAESSLRVTPVDLRDWVTFSTAQAVRVRVSASEVLAVDLWCLEPQQATGVLRYDEDDVSYTVIGGRSWFVTEEGEVGLDPLGNLLVPAGVTHGIDNRAPDPLIIVAVSSPGDGLPPDAPSSTEARAIRPEPATVSPLRRFTALAERIGRTRATPGTPQTPTST
jgi:quercetin dioxygenase-like cupin family protein